ncbi:tetratricopeptide repeat protein [Aromatoleum toluvorans]|uniref:Tetratricopeptide repeat protein n=1 Tax=Aromatoleum toluvorans TaxID=92002 RepID=A0ABX1PYY3_9RHOO|nr:tetratricopeptide repeat protein [Aromatoleum toluvorans]NMG44657.1 tetratricopeptide repeat protein [Aromatoleum toluvorans]
MPKPSHPSFTARTLAAVLLVAVALLAYRGIELNGFHFDDWHNILLNPAVHLERLTLGGLIDAARGAALPHRPFASITFALDWWRGGGDHAAYFLATNLVLHIATGIAVFAFLVQALGRGEPGSPSLRTIAAAGLAAAWWLAQPIHIQAVSYVVQRMTELAALFSVLCLWTYVRGRTAPRGRAVWWALSLLSLALGALSKQNAWITPALILMAEFLIVRRQDRLIGNRLDAALLALPAVVGALGLAALLIDGPLRQWVLRGYEWRDFTLAERLLTQPKVVLFHVSQLLWPLPDRFSLEHDIEIVRSAASPQFWLPMGAILAWTLGGLWLARRRETRAVSFFVLWIPVTLLIESTFIPLELVFEHRMYLPSVGVAGLIALGLAQAPRRAARLAPLASAAVVLVTAFGIWSTQQRLPQWRTEITLLENSTKHAPRSVRVWNELGLKYLENGNLDLARRAIDRANEIEPRWGDGYPFVNRGVLLEAMGQPDKALAVYEETIRLFPRQVLGYNNRGLMRLRAGEFELAIQDFDRAIDTDPAYAPAWTNRGTAQVLRGDTQAALPDLEQAVRLSLRESIAWHYLANIYTAQGRRTEAADARLRACRLGIAKDCSQ